MKEMENKLEVGLKYYDKINNSYSVIIERISENYIHCRYNISEKDIIYKVLFLKYFEPDKNYNRKEKLKDIIDEN